jgi:hypothetical protein
LLGRLDEPEPFVDTPGDLCEDIGGIGVLQFGRLLAGVPCIFAKGGERRRWSIDIAFPSAFASRYASSEVRINIFLTLYLTLRG